jgi:hypothetical protein
MISVTVTVTAAPTEGVITTVALYVPAVGPAGPVTFTLKVSGVLCPIVSLPVVGVTVNHGWDGAPAVQVKVLPPGF